MAAYRVMNQWGGDQAPWHFGGIYVIGNRPEQNVVQIDITSKDDGKTFTGTMTYEGEGPIGFKAEALGDNNYKVQNQWGGNQAPWHDGGVFVIGGRDNQPVVALNATSSNDGLNLQGTMTYKGEGPIGFGAEMRKSFFVQNQWGGSSAPWHDGGTMKLNARPNQNVVALDIKSDDGGKTFTGTMTYDGEGPIGFRATQNAYNNYTVENQWGGSSAPWHPGGHFLIGTRSGQRAVAVKVKRVEGTWNLDGTMTYEGEGPIGFKGTFQGISTRVKTY
ncbi:MAG: lectin ESA-2 [Bacteroidota bacterium]